MVRQAGAAQLKIESCHALKRVLIGGSAMLFRARLADLDFCDLVTFLLAAIGFGLCIYAEIGV